MLIRRLLIGRSMAFFAAYRLAFDGAFAGF